MFEVIYIIAIITLNFALAVLTLFSVAFVTFYLKNLTTWHSYLYFTLNKAADSMVIAIAIANTSSYQTK